MKFARLELTKRFRSTGLFSALSLCSPLHELRRGLGSRYEYVTCDWGVSNFGRLPAIAIELLVEFGCDSGAIWLMEGAMGTLCGRSYLEGSLSH